MMHPYLLVRRDVHGRVFVDHRLMSYLDQWLSTDEIFRLFDAMSDRHLLAFHIIVQNRV